MNDIVLNEIMCMAALGLKARPIFSPWLAAEAARLLKQSELPVSVIARKVGFHGNDRLTEAFRAVFAATPADYRRASTTSSEDEA